MSGEWAALTPLSDAGDEPRSKARRLAESKGFGIGALVRQGVRVRWRARGDTTLAWPVFHEDGFVCGIKYRGLGPRFEGKRAEPGSAIRYPAMPSLYGATENPELVFVTEGETDAAWLLDRAAPGEAILCHHAGAATYHSAWAAVLACVPVVMVATDNDEMGEQLAGEYMRDLPHAKRLRPKTGKDWCSS